MRGAPAPAVTRIPLLGELTPQGGVSPPFSPRNGTITIRCWQCWRRSPIRPEKGARGTEITLRRQPSPHDRKRAMNAHLFFLPI